MSTSCYVKWLTLWRSINRNAGKDKINVSLRIPREYVTALSFRNFGATLRREIFDVKLGFFMFKSPEATRTPYVYFMTGSGAGVTFPEDMSSSNVPVYP